MTTRGEINSNFYQIVNVDANGAPTSVKPEYLGNISNVANANYANFANIANTANTANIANSVSVANVSGIGNIATINLTGSSSNVLYGNGIFAAIPTVSNVANANYANFAGTAYSVSGSNVSGQVANANYSNYSNVANTANSVAVANVVGIGNIATLNLDGNVSNVLSGNGTFVALPTVSANSNYANFAGNVVNSAQPNITSLGTLTSLTVSGLTTATGGVKTGNIQDTTGTNTITVGYTYPGDAGITGNLTLGLGGSGNISANNGTLTGNLTVGNVVSVDSIQFDTANAPTSVAVGQLAYDDSNGSAFYGMKGGNVTLVLGENEFAYARNESGSSLSKGQVVRVTGASGNRLTVDLSLADNDPNSAPTIGFTAESIANNSPGLIQISGTLGGLNTNGTTAGAIVYLSDTTPGGWTTTKPTAPTHTVILGWIERVSATVGSIYIKVDNGYELNELHDVLITSPTTGQALVYESVGNLWVNGIPNIANIAYSVSGGNVSGNVATANVSYYSNIQSGTDFTGKLGIILSSGGNSQIYRVNMFVSDFSGNVNFQAGSTSFGHSGFFGNGAGLTNLNGSNVTGQVPYANIANSVAVANVSGIGNIATINLDGSTSNVLYGNGVFAAIPTISNVANANYANFSNVANTANSVAGSNVSGNVASATLAYTANIVSANTIASEYFITYVTGSGTQTLNIDNGATSNLRYNPSTNVLTSNIFSGNGTQLSNIPGANVTGTVANANFANYSNIANTANSVSVANVTGIGNIATINLDGNVSNVLSGNGSFVALPTVSANANYANFAGNAFSVDAGNIVGTVNLANFATTANSVAGSNVSGEVANANFASYSNVANSANSVSVANVSGIGNIATINLDGNVSNVLSGNGSFVALPTVSANANYANFAGNVVNSAQPNITSLGTLTSLTVSGNISGGNISTTGLANLANVQLKIFEETVLASANTSTSISPDATTGSIFRYTANSNFTFNGMTNAVSGTSALVIITQDGTGNRLLTSTMRFANGTKVLSTAAGAIDIISVVYDGTNYYATLSKGYA